ncbi:uncharacterized protein LOC110226416 [Arabidopsis lyrata subsp. lyrata]|uniref:uncharacterized protein LOC110226416 n=1 Tax=Arabidopsis lyrata subsp. lyrata TaxID=81972 RepID=UPI000A29CE64|nr:uncharacterized protein LOC110226416 [Arabidopsis lyrata subsp. lyrata]|eukprot:XP_020873829.1 uncharacterized protein LOC110226416 [Arabidopsis lyrata subsp. lyrata]
MSRWITRFPKQSLTLCKLSKKMQTFVTNCSIPEEKKLVLGETKKAEHSRKRRPFLTRRKNKPAKKKEENVHATVDIGHNDGQNLSNITVPEVVKALSLKSELDSVKNYR